MLKCTAHCLRNPSPTRPAGVVACASQPSVRYMVESGRKRAFPTQAVYDSYKITAAPTLVDCELLAAVPSGPAMQAGEPCWRGARGALGSGFLA